MIASPERESRWGLKYSIKGVKVELYNWEVPFVKPFLKEEEIRIAALEDIAAMKLETIKERQEKKYFFDIAVLLHRFPLSEMISFYMLKYPYQDKRVVLDALSNISAAEETLDPAMLINISWADVKRIISKHFIKYIESEKGS